MKRKKKQRKSAFKIGDATCLPTLERIAKGGIRLRSGIVAQEDPIRIDKLLNNGIIDEMQHLYGMQIITYWMIANRPFIRTASYEQRIGQLMPDFAHIAISRMSAEDKFYKIMSFLSDRERGLISKICFDEMGAIEAGRALKLPVNSITVYVRAAFDALGNALVKMRTLKREVETA